MANLTATLTDNSSVNKGHMTQTALMREGQAHRLLEIHYVIFGIPDQLVAMENVKL